MGTLQRELAEDTTGPFSSEDSPSAYATQGGCSRIEMPLIRFQQRGQHTPPSLHTSSPWN